MKFPKIPRRELTKDEQMVREHVYAMSKWERFCYYVSIYKFHAIAVILVVSALISIFYSIATAKTDRLYLGIINRSTYSSEYMAKAYSEYAGYDAKKEEVALYDGLGTTPEYFAGGYNLITMYAAADELNLVFTDEEGIDFIGVTGIVAAPSQWMAPEAYEYFKDKITEVPIIKDTTDMSEHPEMEMLPVAVDISGTRVQEVFGLDDDTKYMICIIWKGFEDELQTYSRYLYDIEKGVQPLNYTPPVRDPEKESQKNQLNENLYFMMQ